MEEHLELATAISHDAAMAIAMADGWWLSQLVVASYAGLAILQMDLRVMALNLELEDAAPALTTP